MRSERKLAVVYSTQALLQIFFQINSCLQNGRGETSEICEPDSLGLPSWGNKKKNIVLVGELESQSTQNYGPVRMLNMAVKNIFPQFEFYLYVPIVVEV